VVALGGVLVLAAALTACGASKPDPVSLPHIGTGTRVDYVVPKSIRDLAFTNQDGATVHLSDFAGRTVVLMPGMTLCQETCPLDTASIAAAIRMADGPALDATKDVEYLWVTVDPQRDVPAQLAAYRALYAPKSALPNWQMLTGSPAAIHALWKHFGVFYKKVPQDEVVHNWRTGKLLTYDIQHSDEVFFIDPKGTERYILEGAPSLAGATKVPAEMQRFLSSEGIKDEKATGGWTPSQAVDVVSWMLQRPTSTSSGSM